MTRGLLVLVLTFAIVAGVVLVVGFLQSRRKR